MGFLGAWRRKERILFVSCIFLCIGSLLWMTMSLGACLFDCGLCRVQANSLSMVIVSENLELNRLAHPGWSIKWDSGYMTVYSTNLIHRIDLGPRGLNYNIHQIILHTNNNTVDTKSSIINSHYLLREIEPNLIHPWPSFMVFVLFTLFIHILCIHTHTPKPPTNQPASQSIYSSVPLNSNNRLLFPTYTVLVYSLTTQS